MNCVTFWMIKLFTLYLNHHLLKLSVHETSLFEALLFRWYFFIECWQCSHSRFRFKLSDSGSDVAAGAGVVAAVGLTDVGVNIDACTLLDLECEMLLHCSAFIDVEDIDSRLDKSDFVEHGLLGFFF